MTHLAIDLALGTAGFCWAPDVYGYATETCPRKLTDGARLDWWHDTLRGYVIARDTVVVEAPFIHHAHPSGAVPLIKLHGLLEWLCFAGDVWYVACPPSVLKKWATGNGNASKDLMMACAQERGWAGSDHNEADAYLLHAWYAVTGGER